MLGSLLVLCLNNNIIHDLPDTLGECPLEVITLEGNQNFTQSL